MGIDMKWAQVNDERDRLRETNQRLERNLAHAREQLAAIADTDKADLVRERDHYRREVDRLKRGDAHDMLELDEDEKRAMNAIAEYVQIVARDWRLKSNMHEFTGAVHTLQRFVQHHLLSRLDPGQWASWWEHPHDHDSPRENR